jgi:hypothetical protein
VREQGHRREHIRAVVLQLIFLGIDTDTVEFGGVNLNIRAHFAKVESTLIITLVFVVVPRKVDVPCVVGKSLSSAKSRHETYWCSFQ